MLSQKFGKYLVYADESGDHLLKPNDKDFPFFGLVFVIIEREYYANFFVPQLTQLKLKYFPTPDVILHEHDIRKAQGDFAFLSNAIKRENFIRDITELIENTQFTIISAVINKNELQKQYKSPEPPYHLAMKFCLERFKYFLSDKSLANNQESHITFESRGKREDTNLNLAFQMLLDNKVIPKSFNIKMLSKISNCSGLQLADLVARPIVMNILKPQQQNRAFNTLKSKFYHDKDGRIDRYGLKVFPKSAGDFHKKAP